MQHGEAGDRREPVRREPGSLGAGVDDLNVAAGQPTGELRRQAGFFDPSAGIDAHDRIRIIGVPPVIREMILYAGRWPIGRLSSDRMADGFFAALGAPVEESLDEELPLCLPISRHPLVAAAMRHMNAHLADATFADVCAAAVGFDSPSGFTRVFRRYFGETPLAYRRRITPRR